MAAFLSRDINRSDSLRAQIYGRLRQQIQQGEISAEHRLVDMEIAAQLGISRMPAREALMQLAHEGYLARTTRGFMLPLLEPGDVAEIFEIRRLLEPRAAASAARHLSGEAEARMLDAVRAAHDAVAANDAGALMLANAGFREAWLNEVGNRRLAATIARFVDHVQLVRQRTMSTSPIRHAVLEGLERLHAAFAEHDPIAVQDRMTSFIARAEESFFAAEAPARRS